MWIWVVKHKSRLPKKATDAPSLNVFKARLDRALGNVGWWKISLPTSWGWNKWPLKSLPTQATLEFYEFVNISVDQILEQVLSLQGSQGSSLQSRICLRERLALASIAHIHFRPMRKSSCLRKMISESDPVLVFASVECQKMEEKTHCNTFWAQKPTWYPYVLDVQLSSHLLWGLNFCCP